MKLTLRQFAHVEALARHRNFSRAAAELNVTQPALTRSVKTLEATLDIALFDRLSSGLEITPAGELFLEGARRVLAESADLEKAMAGHMGLTEGSLVISTGPYPGDGLVPDAVAAVISRFPGIACRVREVDWTEVAGHLLTRESDVAMADFGDVADDDRFETEPLISDPLYFMCRGDHPLAGPGTIEFSRMLSFPLVGNRMPGRVARDLSRAAAAGNEGAANQFKVSVEMATFAATKRLVMASDSITLAPLIQAEAELYAGSLRIMHTRAAPSRLNSGIITLKGRSLSPAASVFVEEARRIKADMDRRAALLAERFNVH